jgi:hypothetical protein
MIKKMRSLGLRYLARPKLGATMTNETYADKSVKAEWAELGKVAYVLFILSVLIVSSILGRIAVDVLFHGWS